MQQRKSIFGKPLVNQQIRAPRVRVIDEMDRQLGIMETRQALETAKSHGLDLIQVTRMVDPPVCKIRDYGKFLYWEKKKKRLGPAKKTGEIKGIRLKFGISLHDLETKARQTEKFLKKGNQVRIEMQLRGREKALEGFARGKLYQFLEMLQALTAYKTDRPLKKEVRGLTMIISRQTKPEIEKSYEIKNP